MPNHLNEIDDLINANIGLIKTVVRSFKPQSPQQYDEFMQLGRIGFWKAIKSYDNTRSKFCTAAYNYVRYEILEHLRTNRKYRNRIDGCCEYFKLNGPNQTVKNIIATNAIELLDEYTPPNLTDQESQVLDLIVQGYDRTAISTKLSKSKVLVDRIISSAFDKIRTANNDGE